MKHHEQASPLPVPLEDREELKKLVRIMMNTNDKYMREHTGFMAGYIKLADALLKAGYKKG